MSRHPSPPRNCRTFLFPSWRKRQIRTEDLENEWRDLRRHATIESDPEKMLQLNTEVKNRKRQAEVGRPSAAHPEPSRCP